MTAAGMRHAKPPARGIKYNIVYQIKTLYCLAVNMVNYAFRNAKTKSHLMEAMRAEMVLHEAPEEVYLHFDLCLIKKSPGLVTGRKVPL
jgi:hypothetical protein